MVKVRKDSSSEPVKRTRRALDPEARENQMISLAENLAEKQLMDGTASSQVITHYLKLGTAKYKLELERTKQENALLQAKTEMTQSYKNVEKLLAIFLSVICILGALRSFFCMPTRNKRIAVG